MKNYCIIILTILVFSNTTYSQPIKAFNHNSEFGWLQIARAFLLDAYQSPFAPELQYDPEAWVETMVEMNVNVLRFPIMGKYATIQSVRFSTHKDQGNRDLLQETIDACKHKGIKIVPYIFQGINYQQEIFTNLTFGGGSIIAQPTGYIDQVENRKYVRYPFGIIKKHERVLTGLENQPYVGVVIAYYSPKEHVMSGWQSGITDARTSTLGAFSACLYHHI